MFEELYLLMKPFSRKDDAWFTKSPTERKELESKVISFLKEYPEMASYTCQNSLPFILFCTECNFVGCVEWFINNQTNLNIIDLNGNNIAHYAIKYNLPEILTLCRQNSQIYRWQNKQGVSLHELDMKNKSEYSINSAKKQPAVQCLEAKDVQVVKQIPAQEQTLEQKDNEEKNVTQNKPQKLKNAKDYDIDDSFFYN